MAISAHQVNNVLRVYGDQLRLSMISNRPEDIDISAPDRIGISAKVRRETIIDDIASNIIEKIIKSGSQDNVEKEELKTRESEHLTPMVMNDEDRHRELIFKEIDGNDETINSLSVENSKFLTNKLSVITKKTIKKK